MPEPKTTRAPHSTSKPASTAVFPDHPLHYDPDVSVPSTLRHQLRTTHDETATTQWCNRSPRSVPPSKIVPFLYLGALRDALNASFLSDCRIGTIINLSLERLEVKDASITVHHIDVPDSAEAPIELYFDQAFNIIEGVRVEWAAYEQQRFEHVGPAGLERPRSLFVHCVKGMSRSPTIVASYFIRRNGWTPHVALQFLWNRRPIVGPNFGFVTALEHLYAHYFGPVPQILVSAHSPRLVGARHGAHCFPFDPGPDAVRDISGRSNEMRHLLELMIEDYQSLVGVLPNLKRHDYVRHIVMTCHANGLPYCGETHRAAVGNDVPLQVTRVSDVTDRPSSSQTSDPPTSPTHCDAALDGDSEPATQPTSNPNDSAVCGVALPWRTIPYSPERELCVATQLSLWVMCRNVHSSVTDAELYELMQEYGEVYALFREGTRCGVGFVMAESRHWAMMGLQRTPQRLTRDASVPVIFVDTASVLAVWAAKAKGSVTTQ